MDINRNCQPFDTITEDDVVPPKWTQMAELTRRAMQQKTNEEKEKSLRDSIVDDTCLTSDEDIGNARYVLRKWISNTSTLTDDELRTILNYIKTFIPRADRVHELKKICRECLTLKTMRPLWTLTHCKPMPPKWIPPAGSITCSETPSTTLYTYSYVDVGGMNHIYQT